MVEMKGKKMRFSIWMLIFPLRLFAGDVEIDVQILEKDASAKVSIHHPRGAVIDPQSFTMDGQPLHVRLINTEPMNNADEEMSIYRFKLKDPSEGLHLLPAISVKVQGEVYHSTPLSYTLSKVDQDADYNPLTNPLQLDLNIKGPNPLYPGQRASIVYKIYYQGQVSLTHEELPLLEPKGFEKIGGLDIQDREESNYAVQIITQVIQAQQPGTYQFPASVIEGETDQTRLLKTGPKLHAEAAPITIEVAPFPNEGKPASFNGALGRFILTLKMTTPNQLRLGDIVNLEANLQSSANLENVYLPNLACQPGFSGRIQLSDLPPAAKIENQGKVFNIELRPSSVYVKAIPSIEFSYYDPATQKYGRQRTAEIPITVTEEGKAIRRAASPVKMENVQQALNQIQLQETIPPLPLQLNGAAYAPLSNGMLAAVVASGGLYLLLIKRLRKDKG